MISISKRIADELSARENQVEAAIALLDEGSTVPFIARYRKEMTGSLDEVQIRAIEERRAYVLELEDRRRTVLSSIEEQGKLTDALRASAPGLTIAVRQGNSTAVKAWGQHAAALRYQTPR